MKREEQIKELLRKNNLLCAPTEKITSDASNRKYLRLTKGNKTVILMDSNPKKNEPVNNFIYFTNFLRKHHFSAPKIYDSDIPNGLLLLEDLGARNFADILKVKPKVETNIYKEAVNQLIMIQSKETPKQAKPYSTEILIEEALLFTEWYLGETNSSRLSTQFTSLLTPLLKKIDQTKPTLVLRDFHAENLIWMNSRKNFKRVGLLDYQDALIGHPAYDIASLLKDARRDVSIEVRDIMTNHYLEKTKHNKDLFLRDYSILSAQRNLKIIGIFSRLSIRDKKKNYVKLIPRVWKNLENDFMHPDLKNLSKFINAVAPYPNVKILKNLSQE
ncbi:MAG: phosphotransferase [Paracoccaceae bacterium]|jgi:aminoglycoside/choline kinase family phosphotransferase|nr:phosphotransferase [Paracoccaceae bacterium]